MKQRPDRGGRGAGGRLGNERRPGGSLARKRTVARAGKPAPVRPAAQPGSGPRVRQGRPVAAQPVTRSSRGPGAHSGARAAAGLHSRPGRSSAVRALFAWARTALLPDHPAPSPGSGRSPHRPDLGGAPRPPDLGGTRRPPDLTAARRLLGLLSLLLVVGLGLILFLTSAAFGVEEILVVGSTHLSSAQVAQVCGVDLGTNIFKVPTGAIRERLLANPRVAEATVSRKLPGRLVVRIVEREGVVLLPCQEQFAEIDAAGLPIKFHRYVTALGLPIVTGVEVGGVTLGTRVTGQGLDAVLCCATALGPRGRAAVAEVHLDADGEMVLYTRDGTPVYLGEPSGLEAKVAAFLGILDDITSGGLEASYIDVRYPRYPVVGSKSGVPESAAWTEGDVFPVFGEP